MCHSQSYTLYWEFVKLYIYTCYVFPNNRDTFTVYVSMSFTSLGICNHSELDRLHSAVIVQSEGYGVLLPLTRTAVPTPLLAITLHRALSQLCRRCEKLDGENSRLTERVHSRHLVCGCETASFSPTCEHAYSCMEVFFMCIIHYHSFTSLIHNGLKCVTVVLSLQQRPHVHPVPEEVALYFPKSCLFER